MPSSTFKLTAAAAFLCAAVWTFSESARANDYAGLPLPDDVRIDCFDADDLSASQAGFCGIWGEGRWDGVTPHCLVVEKINADGSAHIIYAWGKAPMRKYTGAVMSVKKL